MKVLRTPDSRFHDLPDFPFAPHYREIRDADGTMLRVCAIESAAISAAARPRPGSRRWCGESSSSSSRINEGKQLNRFWAHLERVIVASVALHFNRFFLTFVDD